MTTPQIDFVPSPAGDPAPAVTTGILGFTNANYYQGPAGVLQGSATMTHVVIGRLKTARGGAFESIAGCSQLFGGGGYELSKDGTRFTALITDGLPAAISSTGATFGDSSGGGILTDFSAGMMFYFAQTWNTNAGNSFVNGRNQFNIGTANAGYTAYGAGRYRWGMNAGGNNSPFQGSIIGSALHESAVFTEDQLFAHYLDCRDALDLVDGSLNWEHRWLASEATVGSPAPATISDVGTGTARDLSLVGALTVETRRPFWIQSVP